MADPDPSFLISPDGRVGAYDTDYALTLRGAGYVPAGAQQIEDFKKEQAFHEKYGTAGQQLKTFVEGAGSALTLGLSDWLERGLGVQKEDMAARAKENPHAYMAGTIAGVAAPLILTAGGSAAVESAEAGVAAAKAAGTGLEAAEEALATARVAARGTIAQQASRLSAPSIISRAGELGSEGVKGLLGRQSSAVGRIAAKAAQSGAGSAIEGAAYGLGQVVHESALGDPNLTASRAIEEIGLSGLLGGGVGGVTGALGQLIGEAAAGAPGQKLGELAHRFEAERNLGAASGGMNTQALSKKLAQNIGLENINQIGREGGEMGLVSVLSTPGETWQRAEEAMSKAGRAMDEQKAMADAITNNAAPSAAHVASVARNDILKPLESNFADTGEADQFRKIVEGFENKFGAGDPENKLTFSDLHDARKALDTKIYGLKGNMVVSSEFKQALHEFRSLLSDEIQKGLDATPGMDATAWKAANRQYQVASVFQRYAEKGVNAWRGNNLAPLSTMLGAIGGGAIGGPLGALALGVGSNLAKRFGSGVLGAGARAVRGLIDDGAAEGLASRTADEIAALRESGIGTGAEQLWNKLGQVAAPGTNVGRDLARESLQSHLAQSGPEGTPAETVAALSRLERASQRVQNRVDDGVSALVRGAPRVMRGEAAAGIAGHFADSPDDSQKVYQRRAEQLRHLAASPELLQQRLNQAVADVREHAPETAQALQVALSRCVAALSQSLPPTAQHAPLEKPEPPTPDAVASFNRCFEAVNKPSVILKHAAAGVLTHDTLTAVKMAHPQQFAAIQQALVAKLSSHKSTIPYAQRQMISLIMGRDMDGTGSPSMINASQAAFASSPSPRQSIKPTAKGLGKLSLSTRMLTPAQASAKRGTGGE